MAQHSSGAKLLVRADDGRWLPLSDMYLEEGKSYAWQSTVACKLYMQSIPLPMTVEADGACGVMDMPFQSGEVQFDYVVDGERLPITQYVYSDSRKLGEQEFRAMLHDILVEGAILFQESGLTQHVAASGFTKRLSLLQWHYIEEGMAQLRTIFRKIAERPLKKLVQQEDFSRREHVKHVTEKTLRWLEMHGPARGATHEQPPEFVREVKKYETYDVPENRVLLKNISDLQHVLRQYKASSPAFAQKADRYLHWLSSWKRQPFLQNVQSLVGKIQITQAFRKHPVYRLWFNWFYDLYEFNELAFDMKQKLALKDTYALYEMWCLIQVIQHVRKRGLLNDVASLFTYEDGRYFLHLQENHASKIRLTNGSAIYFQKVIQSNSSPYYSYTQRMIPDIVIEKNDKLYILDPKYRVHANVHLALAEMHKYRDGILHRESDERAVQEVYILTPQRGEMSEVKDFYSEAYQKRYGMGAFELRAGKGIGGVGKWLDKVLME